MKISNLKMKLVVPIGKKQQQKKKKKRKIRKHILSIKTNPNEKKTS